MEFRALNSFVKLFFYNRRSLITGTLLSLVGVYPLLYGEFNWMSLILIILAIGNFYKNNLARKLTILIYFILMLLVVFLFFPPFTSSAHVPLYEYSTSIRVFVMIFIELIILLLMLLLKNRYAKLKLD